MIFQMVAADSVTNEEAKTPLNYHNQVRPKVNPPATEMQNPIPRPSRGTANNQTSQSSDENSPNRIPRPSKGIVNNQTPQSSNGIPQNRIPRESRRTPRSLNGLPMYSTFNPNRYDPEAGNMPKLGQTSASNTAQPVGIILSALIVIISFV